MYLKTPQKGTIFEGEYNQASLPSAEEIRYIGRAHEECYYYQYGLNLCREKVNEKYIKDPQSTDADGYLKCKEVADAFYNCTTKDFFGKQIEDMDDEVKPYFKNYTNCMFKDQENVGVCRKFFDDILRYYIHKPDSPLKNYY